MVQEYGKSHGRGTRMMFARKPWHKRKHPELRNGQSKLFMIVFPLTSFATIWKSLNITYLDHKVKVLDQCF